MRRAAGLVLEMPGVESEGAGEAIQAKSKALDSGAKDKESGGGEWGGARGV